MANEKKNFYAQFSDAELDEAEQIEKDVRVALLEGWSEDTAQAFVHGVMLIRKREPDMQIPATVDLALRTGIIRIVGAVYGTGDAALKPKKRANGKSKLSGKGV